MLTVQRMGAIGVAYGTLLGSFVSLGIHLVYTVPRTQQIPIQSKSLLLSGVGLPGLALMPLLALTAVSPWWQPVHPMLVLPLVSVVSAATAAWSWRIQQKNLHAERVR